MLLAPPAGAFKGGGKGGMEKLEPGRGGAVVLRATERCADQSLSLSSFFPFLFGSNDSGR